MDNYKTKFSNEQLLKIKQLFEERLGSRKIAKILGCNRSTIVKAYRQLNLDTNITRPKTIYKDRICKICKEFKLVSDFRKRKFTYECYCKDCERKSNNIRLARRIKERKLVDKNFLLRTRVSYSVWKVLRNKKTSCSNLEYTMNELRLHLESKFEYWMNWDNYGAYIKKTWNDNDLSTWKWSIDHIIPQADFKYESMNDDEFKKCWSLNNLRPISAKQNVLDGRKHKVC